jgi:hypothetical protein
MSVTIRNVDHSGSKAQRCPLQATTQAKAPASLFERTPRSVKGNPVKIFLNGERLQVSVTPEIVNGNTPVPLRAIFEGLHADVASIASSGYARRGVNSISYPRGILFHSV